MRLPPARVPMMVLISPKPLLTVPTSVRLKPISSRKGVTTWAGGVLRGFQV